jgi:hypothetical protein
MQVRECASKASRSSPPSHAHRSVQDARGFNLPEGCGWVPWQRVYPHPMQAGPPPQPAPQPQSEQPCNSQLTEEQRARAERNRLEALRRRSASRQSSQSLQLPAAPNSCQSSLPGSLLPGHATSRPSSALRGIFMQPQCQQATQQERHQRFAAAPTWRQTPEPPLPCSQRSWPTLVPAPNTSSIDSMQPYQQAHPGSSAQQHERQHMGWHAHEAAAQSARQLPSTEPAPPIPPSVPDVYAAPRPDSSAAHQLNSAPQVSGQQGRRGFVFCAPPGLGTGGDKGGVATGSSQNTTHQAPQTHTGAAGWPCQALSQPVSSHSAAPGLQGGCFMGAIGPPPSAAPTAGPTAWAAAARRPPAAPAQASKRGRASNALAAARPPNITCTFDPTPRPQKPLAQSTLQQAVSRHWNAKAAAKQQEQEVSVAEPAPGFASGPCVSQQGLQRGGEQAGVVGCDLVPSSLPAQAAGALYHNTRNGPASFLPPQQPSTLPAVVAQPGSDWRASSAAGALGRPAPLLANSLWAAQHEAAHANSWMPAQNSSPPRANNASAELLCDTHGNAARRRRLQHLLAADADPFAAASSSGRRWAWLQQPLDSQGRSPGDPEHDPTTILIPASAWGTDLKGADAQYWRIKRDGCAHMVLFFQEGGRAPQRWQRKGRGPWCRCSSSRRQAQGAWAVTRLLVCLQATSITSRQALSSGPAGLQALDPALDRHATRRPRSVWQPASVCLPVQDRDADVGMRVGLQAMGGSRGTSANMWTVGCNVRCVPSMFQLARPAA